MQKILFLDDDEKFQNVVAEVLRLEHYEVDLASNAADGLDLFKKNTYDLIISDIKMDEIDGLQFLQIIRKLDEQAKVILLTGSQAEEDELRGLELHVNDFIKKPVTIRILLTRIDRVLNKNKFARQIHVLESASQSIKVDTKAKKVYKNGELAELTMLEYDLLVYFLRNKNIALSRQQMIKDVWRIADFTMEPRSVDTHIKNLRAKLSISCIYSIRGVGYEWSE
ncbi:response regulator transcription factor [Culicoidibacter larvae]|uniref:Response regulator transcription factor n=1 Tax=Culicoidibacter larvae TaxID=2579976 RepID=A0A5R8QGT6_9FIRM|nr:response regulator transcription factor [Culicoidibacter larvae]TLG77208.1 response regulator transcription factor [Culicoidibacter larvae]